MSTALLLPPDDAAVAAYLGNQLPESQAEAFEIYCLEHPEFARKVELDLCMKHGLREIGKHGLPRPFAFRLSRTWAMAASLGALIVCGLLFLGWSHRPSPLIAYRNLNSVPAALRAGVHLDVTLLRLRGPDAMHQVRAPSRNGVLMLRIFPDITAGKEGYSASVALGSQIGSQRLLLKQLRTDADGFLELFLPLSDVVGHTLKVTITSAADPSGVPETAFQLQVLPATG